MDNLYTLTIKLSWPLLQQTSLNNNIGLRINLDKLTVDLQNINFLAILIAAAVMMVLGAIWYSRLLFGNAWMKANSLNNEDLQSGQNGTLYVITAFSAMILGFALEVLATNLKLDTTQEALTLGFLVGFGIVLTTTIPDYIFSSRGMRLLLINVFYPIVAVVLMSLIVVYI